MIYQIPMYMIYLRMISYHNASYTFKWMSFFNIITLVYEAYCSKQFLKYYFVFNFRIIWKLYIKTASMVYYFIGTSKKFKQIYYQVFSPNSVGKNGLKITFEALNSHAIRKVLLIEMCPRDTSAVYEWQSPKQSNEITGIRLLFLRRLLWRGKTHFKVCWKSDLVKLLPIPQSCI